MTLMKKSTTALIGASLALSACTGILSDPAPPEWGSEPAPLIRRTGRYDGEGPGVLSPENEEEFFQRLTDFKWEHAWNYPEWLEENTKTDEEVAAILEEIPPEERQEYVLEYFRAHNLYMQVGKSLRRGYFRHDCSMKDEMSFVIPPRGSPYCTNLESMALDGRERHPDALYLETGDAEEATAMLPRLQAELWEKIAGMEDAVEVILEMQLREVFVEVLGEEPPVNVTMEIENEPLAYIGIYRTGDKTWVDSFYMLGNGLDDLKALVKEFDGYSFIISYIGGFSSNPILVEASDFLHFSAMAGHEFTHHIEYQYPLGQEYYDGARVNNETTSTVVSREVAQRLLYTMYPEYFENRFWNTTYEYILEKMWFDEEGFVRVPEKPTPPKERSALESKYEDITVFELRRCAPTLQDFFEYMKDNVTAEDTLADLDSCLAEE